MRKYNKYLVVSLLLSLLSFSTYAAEENNDFPTNAGSEYNNGGDDFFATATERDNDFCIKGGGWSSATFSKITKNDTELYSVTSGEPFSGINPNNQPSDKKCVRVRSGRKNSTKPMKWALAARNLNYTDAVYALASNDGLVKIMSLEERNLNHTQAVSGTKFQEKGNFAFTGTLTLTDKYGETFSCPNLVIGQFGSQMGNNVWFMFSNYATNTIECTNSQGVEVEMSLNSSGSNNTFKIAIK